MSPSSKPAKSPKKSTSPEKTPKDKPTPGPLKASTAPGPSKASKEKPKDIIPIPAVDSDEDSDGDSEDDGVDEAGMERLMKALGDDGLDEFETMQLNLTLGGDAAGGEGDDDDEDTSDEEFTLDKNADESSGGEGSDSDDGEDEGEFEDEDEDVEGEEDVALDDVESVDDDAVPRQKIEIDNTVALARIRETIQLDKSFPWTETLVVTYPEAIEVDVNDDLNRELAFYKQALHGANAARALAAKHNFPFTRPTDYFAEMVKSDAHMERIRQRLLDESAGIKKSDDKRKEREGKKFGKQVQIERLKEREKGKKDMEERLKGLKRKRGDVLDKPDDDAFDIAVEDAISDRPAKRGRGAAPRGRGAGGERGGPKVSRTSRDQKYGFGGGGKRSKSNTRESTDDFGGGRRGAAGGRGGRGGARGGSSRGGFGGRGGSRGGGGGRGGAGGSKRLGKGRRETARSRI